MVPFTKLPVYKAYEKLGRPPKDAAPFETCEGGETKIEPGELYCRFPNADGDLCGKPYAGRNCLLLHVGKTHGVQIVHQRGRGKKLEPEVRRLESFYLKLMKNEEYEIEPENEPSAKPATKRKRSDDTATSSSIPGKKSKKEGNVPSASGKKAPAKAAKARKTGAKTPSTSGKKAPPKTTKAAKGKEKSALDEIQAKQVELNAWQERLAEYAEELDRHRFKMQAASDKHNQKVEEHKQKKMRVVQEKIKLEGDKSELEMRKTELELERGEFEQMKMEFEKKIVEAKGFDGPDSKGFLPTMALPIADCYGQSLSLP